MNIEARLTYVFFALADPTRRAILARLAGGEATVSELTEPFHLAQPTISKHLRPLEEAGLIRQARDAQRRPRRLVVRGPLQKLDAAGATTRMIVTIRCASAEHLDQLVSVGVDVNTEKTFDNLVAFVAKRAA